ncbi:MAG TPA: FAD-dependent oxidoreductase, partial [Soehngenia sp.]|nr:FAD-dependent oxidoreductase [Soehngenia sp.]
MSKIVVVGANHAGTAAVNTLLNLKKDNEVVVFDRNSNISFLGCGMALWIGKQIAGPDGLFYSSKEELEKKGAKINMETEVEKIDFKNKRIFVKEKDGKTYDTHYDKLILATGSLPIVPNVKGTDLDNVQLVKLYQNAQEVIEKLNNDDIRHVTVVGAGYIGVELAEAFKRNGKEVALIDVAPTSLSSYYDLEFTHLMDDNLRNHGIDLHFEEKLVEIQGNG